MGVTSVTIFLSKDDPFYKFGRTSHSHTHDPFDWGETWYVWLLYSASCCLFEFLLFRDKKIIVKKIKKKKYYLKGMFKGNKREATERGRGKKEFIKIKLKEEENKKRREEIKNRD